MAKPNLSVSINPVVDGKATCLPLAASAVGAPAHVKIVLRLDITNSEPNPVTIYRVRYSFPTPLSRCRARMSTMGAF
jgi:hypothetical protein